MKVTVVPAQVTTVEDRIIGSLGFSQMLLLITPVFICAGLFALLPPFMGGVLYKYLLMGALAFICCILAIRIKGIIIAFWLVTILRYNLRPTYYLFNKNTAALRQDYPAAIEPSMNETAPVLPDASSLRPRLTMPQTIRVLAAIDNPAANFRFETTKKGGLNVRLTEIEK